MRTTDLMRYALGAVGERPGRSLLTVLGIAIGVAAVVLLTAIGEGVHRFVLAEFSQFGTNLIAVSPGRTTTLGMSGALVSNVRPLSLEDARALARLPEVEAVVPVVQGNVAVEHAGRSRRTTVFGAGPGVPEIWSMRLASGRFLPERGANPPAFAVLGAELAVQLFGQHSPLGARIRVGGEPYRVIGVMARKGQMLGFDLDDTLYIPAERALALFDRDSLMEIDLLYDRHADSAVVAERVRALLIRRHGTEDFTITTQDQMLAVLGSVLGALTTVVGALGAISLLVGGIGILTIMTIAVGERRREIGLLRALGAGREQIRWLFLLEAMLLALLGGLVGLAIGALVVVLLGLALPGLPLQPAWDFVLLAECGALLLGLVAGVVPALRAARLDPVRALHEQ
ncbi:ABC transporter permease [Marichromatium sp. AB31]|uniref:ABC transporter permease n=1 Tax=Marichromatium sp. AB31 TaxID=2483362 RepID=UPI000F4012D4|nr:ABC transporter permease [Marichromatium sp. AB31]RNE89185.1 ABC transporter permease [Marichromatium sp. AB31]